MNYQLIYQFCLKNYENEFQMLDRIHYTIKDYRQDMMELERYTYNLNFFNVQNPMILVDIIPPFLEPVIKTFDFSDFENDKVMIEQIATSVKDFVMNEVDPEKCLVIQIIHDISVDNNV